MLLRFLDLLFVFLSVFLLSGLFYPGQLASTTDALSWGLLLGVYLSLFSNIFELYDLQKAKRFQTLIVNVLLTTALTLVFFLLTTTFISVAPENALEVIYLFAMILSVLLLWRGVYIGAFRSARFSRRVLLIGDGREIAFSAVQLQLSDPSYKVVGYIDTSGAGGTRPGRLPFLREFPLKELQNTISKNGIQEILVAGPEAGEGMKAISEPLMELLKRKFPVRDYHQVYEEKTRRMAVPQIEEEFHKFFLLSGGAKGNYHINPRRMADILISLPGMLLGLLLIPFVLLGNLLGNKGRLFYIQERVGEHGRRFRMLKFRSMSEGAEPKGAQWAKRNDSRAAWFGKFLRRSRLDEFPQFYNILKGEMTLIGPRPERPVFVEQLSERYPFYEARHVVKPGLTGWAQVNMDYGECPSDSLEKLQYDLYYIKNRSFLLDVAVLTKTLTTLVHFRGQ